MVFQTAGSNATEVKNQIDALLADVQANAPRGGKVTQMMSTNDFLFASIKNVVVTLLEAVLLVILIVLLFLQDWRSTMIPFISIVVSLVGTFAFMVVADFSINLITLFDRGRNARVPSGSPAHTAHLTTRRLCSPRG